MSVTHLLLRTWIPVITSNDITELHFFVFIIEPLLVFEVQDPMLTSPDFL